MLDEKIRNKIIISADDFGKSELANRNILRLAKAGKFDRVSVMIEGDFDEKEIEEILATGVKLDIHFELVWQKRRRNLLRDNTLRQGIVFLVNYLWGDWPVPVHPRSGAAEVKREWNKQIEKFRKFFGRTPDGISSHEHTHYFPIYFRIALELAKQYDIAFIRFGKKGLLGERNSVYFILKKMRWLNKRKFFRSKLSSSDYFAVLDWIANFEEFLMDLPEGKTEIACHPERKEEYNFILNNF
ncbi:MAG: ChbG/HpnK family deacetylase [Patescibacteria group bacterium]|nr:ChbG/HpnK family deacetylase [Patescibacteria group bacterium]